jgi:hypothetical protein
LAPKNKPRFDQKINKREGHNTGMASKKESPLGQLIKKIGVKEIAPAAPKKKAPKAYRHHSGDEKLASWMDEIYIPSGRPLFPLVPKAKPKVKAKAKPKAGKAVKKKAARKPAKKAVRKPAKKKKKAPARSARKPKTKARKKAKKKK